MVKVQNTLIIGFLLGLLSFVIEGAAGTFTVWFLTGVIAWLQYQHFMNEPDQIVSRYRQGDTSVLDIGGTGEPPEDPDERKLHELYNLTVYSFHKKLNDYAANRRLEKMGINPYKKSQVVVKMGVVLDQVRRGIPGNIHIENDASKMQVRFELYNKGVDFAQIPIRGPVREDPIKTLYYDYGRYAEQ